VNGITIIISIFTANLPIFKYDDSSKDEIDMLLIQGRQGKLRQRSMLACKLPQVDIDTSTNDICNALPYRSCKGC